MTLPDKEKMIILLGALIIVLSFLYVGMVTFFVIPDSGKDIAQTAVGFLLGSCVATIINYIWGSSAGSAAKSKAMEKQLKINDDGVPL